MPRHRKKGRAQLLQRERQRPGGLRSIQHERHPACAAERRDLLDRQDIAKYIGHMRAEYRPRTLRHRCVKCAQRVLRVKEPPSGNFEFCSGGGQWPPDRVVLEPRDHDLVAGAHQRAYRDVQRVRRIHCKDDLLRFRAEQLCRDLPAAVNRLCRFHRGRMSSSAHARAPLHRPQHCKAHGVRLLQRCRRSIQINHSAASSAVPSGSNRNTPENRCPASRKSAALRAPSRPSTRTA